MESLGPASYTGGGPPLPDCGYNAQDPAPDGRAGPRRRHAA